MVLFVFVHADFPNIQSVKVLRDRVSGRGKGTAFLVSGTTCCAGRSGAGCGLLAQQRSVGCQASCFHGGATMAVSCCGVRHHPCLWCGLTAFMFMCMVCCRTLPQQMLPGFSWSQRHGTPWWWVGSSCSWTTPQALLWVVRAPVRLHLTGSVTCAALSTLPGGAIARLW